MQQIFYRGSAYAVLCYPYLLEAYNTDKWTGWTHVPGDASGGQQGAVLNSYNNIDTYRFVEQKTAASAKASGGSSTALIVSIVAALIVVAAIVVVMLRRRRREEEAT